MVKLKQSDRGMAINELVDDDIDSIKQLAVFHDVDYIDTILRKGFVDESEVVIEYHCYNLS